MYFRGAKRNSLYISNLECGPHGEWTWEESFARLFQYEPTLATSNVSKKFGVPREQILLSVHYRGFDGWVLRTHLILPHG
jgi:hypothetical protein